MLRDSENCRSNCPINFLLETFGDKWTLLIVRDLMFKGKHSFREFLMSDEKIATNILTDRLKRLEEHGIVSKRISESNRSSFVYTLTDKGRDLLPVMVEITAWSAKHDARTNTPTAFQHGYKEDKARLIEELRLGIGENSEAARQK